MSTEFKVGDKVRRIGGSFLEVDQGGIYEVEGVHDRTYGDRALTLTGKNSTYDADKFELYTRYVRDEAPKADSTRASKHDSAKADVSLIPREALEAAARALMVGEKKYGRYNYYKGHKVSQLIAAMMRHATAYMDGEENDPQDGQPHLGSVIACAAMILKQQALGTSIDDRYGKEKKDENDKK